MSYPITAIEGIAATNKQKLAKIGIKTTGALLGLCCTPKGRKKASEEGKLSEKQLLKWSNMADLMRIKGVATQFAELLEASGVDTVKELKTRRPDNLSQKLAEVNAKKKLTRRVPTESMVANWVAQAKKLKPMMRY